MPKERSFDPAMKWRLCTFYMMQSRTKSYEVEMRMIRVEKPLWAPRFHWPKYHSDSRWELTCFDRLDVGAIITGSGEHGQWFWLCEEPSSQRTSFAAGGASENPEIRGETRKTGWTNSRRPESRVSGGKHLKVNC